MSLAGALTQTARCGGERANHKSTAPPCENFIKLLLILPVALIAISALRPSQTIKLYFDGVFTAKAGLSLTVVDVGVPGKGLNQDHSFWRLAH